MPRQAIPCEAREIIYNVYLYFENEAKRFERIEDCYFQKVQERVADACCVSRRFISYLLKEKDTYGPDAFKQESKPGRRRKKKETGESDSAAKTPKTVTIRVPVVYSKPPPLTPLVTPHPPPLTPITTSSHVPRLIKPINQNLPPPLTPFTQRPEMPPLTPLVKSQAPSSTLAPPSLIPNKMPPLTPKPQLLIDTLRKISFETVPIEYEPTNFDSVTVKCEVSCENDKKYLNIDDVISK